jgi:hypothetical protein
MKTKPRGKVSFTEGLDVVQDPLDEAYQAMAADEAREAEAAERSEALIWDVADEPH